MEGSAYKEKLNSKMRGSKRRSRLGLGVSSWTLGSPKLGIIDTIVHPPQYAGIAPLSRSSPQLLWELLRRSKILLSWRTIDDFSALIDKLDRRKDWNKYRSVDTLLDVFTALKYSYSSMLPFPYRCATRGREDENVVGVVCSADGSTAYVSDVTRSHSIRLDPVDAPKELAKYRARIQNVIEFAYANGLVPVMMTLTVYHRWNDLAPLCRVLQLAWSDLFGGGKAGLKRRKHIGLYGYVRRMEETFNDGDDEYNKSCNSGWHPHYHIVMLIPRDKLDILSESESQLRKTWVSLVRKYYVKEFGEDIPQGFLSAFEEHGLVLSRYKSAEHAARCGCEHGCAGQLLEVKDGLYLSKILRVSETPVYGGDSELVSFMQKNSKTPFEMLCGAMTANLADLWCEYAIATKGIPSFKFSRGLQKKVDEYFKASVRSTESLDTKVTIRLKFDVYQWLYRHFLVGVLLEKAKQGIDVVRSWLASLGFVDALVSDNESVDTLPLDEVAVEESFEKTQSVSFLSEFVEGTTFSLGDNQGEVATSSISMLPVESHDTSEPVACTSFSEDVLDILFVGSADSIINFIFAFTVALFKTNSVSDYSADIFKTLWRVAVKRRNRGRAPP